MDINTLYTSKYLKKEDFPRPVILTIRQITSEDVSMENQPTEMKPIMFFNEFEQGLVLNRTNAQIVMAVYGSETNDWIGRQIVAKNDPSIQYQGKFTGGIRLDIPEQVVQQNIARSMQQSAPAQPARPPAAYAQPQVARHQPLPPLAPGEDPFPAPAADLSDLNDPPY